MILTHRCTTPIGALPPNKRTWGRSEIFNVWVQRIFKSLVRLTPGRNTVMFKWAERLAVHWPHRMARLLMSWAGTTYRQAERKVTALTFPVLRRSTWVARRNFPA